MEKKFKYIQFALVPRNFKPRVKFITDIQEGENPISMDSDLFLKFLLQNFTFVDKDALLFDFYSHKIIYLDNTTGIHISKNVFEDAFNADFNTLKQLNEKKKDDDYLTVSLNRARSVISKMDFKFKNPYTKS